MIKAVIQAVPQYIMFVFLLPDSFCKEIQGLISKFWWGGTDKKRPMYWIAWEFVCQSKMDGGSRFQMASFF
ncbi:hypothetical protein M5689_017096 [Euphorbia peplus]|nr:hypothetical protein M5689_017096 [Euphorbia peplus]